MTPEGQLEVLNSLTTDPRRIATRIRQAALLEAAQVHDRAVHTLVEIAGTGRLTLENILVLRDTGIDIDGMVNAIQRADHTLRATQDHATAPPAAQNHNRALPDDRDDSEPAKRRWRIRHRPETRLTLSEWHGTITAHWHVYAPTWHVTAPTCHPHCIHGCTCTTRPTWQAAIDYVNNELRNRALTAIENQEATNQPQEDQ